MYANYHTHTSRCNHAVGADEDYVKRAIAEGVSVLGFSDHAPMPYPNGYSSWYKMRMDELGDYIASVQYLRDKYADKIKIHLGLEAEYYPSLWEGSVKSWRGLPIEYLLLGQHFVTEEYVPDPDKSTSASDDGARLSRYVDLSIMGIKTGMFTYVAHPDILNYTGTDFDHYDAEMARLINAAKEHKLPLEYNLLGMCESRAYPVERFWRLAASLDADVIVACDAHEPWRVADKAEIAEAYSRLNSYGVRLIDRVELVDPGLA